MAHKGSEADYFISRAGADGAFAVWLAQLIRAQGGTTFVQDDDFGHESFVAQMHDALSGGARVVVLLTPDYLKSEYCIKETNVALSGDPNNRLRRLIPLRLRPCAPSGMLNDIPYLDLLPELRAGDATVLAEKILHALGIEKRTLAAVPPVPAQFTIEAAPKVHPRIRPNPNFTGREDLLANLNALLLGGMDAGFSGSPKPAALLNAAGPLSGAHSVATMQTLGGMGGVGKSELAREFAWRNQSAYAGVWWIEAETRDGMLNGLIELGMRFDPRIGEEKDRERAAQMTLERLEAARAQKPWLLIYDNVEAPAALEGMTPRSGAHVLVTSRWRDWSGEADMLDVDVFPPEVAANFLCDAAGRSMPQDREQAAILAKELGYLPLALSHAASYCRPRKGTSFLNYLQKLSDRVKHAPDRRTVEGKAYPRSIYSTFTLALERVSAGQPELDVPPRPQAGKIMGVLAYLSAEDVPLELFPESLVPADELADTIASLDEAALITQTRLKDGGHALNVHRLVQRVMQAYLDDNGGAEASLALATGLLANAFPNAEQATDVRSWPRCRLLEPHVIALIAHAPAAGPASSDTARLLNQYAVHLKSRGEYREAEPLARRAIAIWEANLGRDHGNVAAALITLGEVLRVTNRVSEAESCYRRALAVYESSQGPNHPNVGTALINLAECLRAANLHSEAEPLYRRALAIYEASYGPDHPNVATAVNNLAEQLRVTNRLADAEPLYRRALTIYEATLGPRHPNVAVALNNLAGISRAANRIPEAEQLFRRALSIYEESLGTDHPDVAIALANLAELLRAVNRNEEAEPYYRRALAIDEARFGDAHPNVARDLNNLGLMLQAVRRFDEAEPLFRRALEIHRECSGPGHPDVAVALINLAELYRLTGRFSEAEPLYRRALAIDEANFGASHVNVGRDLNNLALMLQAANRPSEAEQFFKRAIEVYERSVGENHPNVAIPLANCAELLRLTGRSGEAETLYRRALAIEEAGLGANHTNVARDLNNLGFLLHGAHRFAEAEPLLRRALAIYEANLGPYHADVAVALANLGELLRLTGRPAEAEPVYRRALAINRQCFGPRHANVARDLNNLALVLQAMERFDEAEPLFREALAVFTESFGANHPSTEVARANHEALLDLCGKPAAYKI